MDINRRSFALVVKPLDDHTGCSCLNTAEPFTILLLSLLRYCHQRSDRCQGTYIFVLCVVIPVSNSLDLSFAGVDA